VSPVGLKFLEPESGMSTANAGKLAKASAPATKAIVSLFSIEYSPTLLSIPEGEAEL
jgi:hypothetical protein